jgi:hypothetical protein
LKTGGVTRYLTLTTTEISTVSLSRIVLNRSFFTGTTGVYLVLQAEIDNESEIETVDIKYEICLVKSPKYNQIADIRLYNEPLLYSRMKPKRGQPQQEERLIYLIPELCAMTGL